MSAGGIAAQQPAEPATGRIAFSPARAWLIARVTLRGAVRERLLLAIVVIALAFVVGVRWLRVLNFGSSELKFVEDFGLGSIALFGGGLAIVATAQLFFAEIEQRTIATLLAKPVRRSEFVLGKFFAAAALAAMFCGLMIAALAAVLWLGEAPAAGGAAGLVAAGVAIWLKLAVLAALTLLLASFARSQLFAVSMGFLVWAICEFQYVVHEAATRGGSVLSRALAGFVGIALPNFQIFDLAADPTRVAAWAGLPRVAIYCVVYVAVVCVLAAVSFRRREI